MNSLAEDVVAASCRAVESWMLDAAGDPTLYRGVSLGRCMRSLLWSLDVLPAFKEAAAPNAETDRSSLDWRPPRLELSPAKVAACRLWNALPRPAVERPVLASYYPAIAPLLECDAFPLTLSDPPPLRAAHRYLGSRILVEPRTPPRWTPAERAELDSMRARWEASVLGNAARPEFSYNGVSLWPQLESAFRRAWDSIPSLAWACRRLDEEWHRRRPSLLVLPMDTPPYQALLANLARAHHIPSVLLMHGVPFDYAFPFEHAEVDHLFVWGPEQKRLYTESQPEIGRKAVVVGHPAFDRLASRRGAPASGPIRKVLMLSQPLDDSSGSGCAGDVDRYALAVSAALCARHGLEVTLRLHPSESEEHYRLLLAGRAVRFERAAPLADTLAESDLVVGPLSTVMLETIALGRPLLCVNLTRREYPAPFDGNWGIAPVRDEQSLAAALDEALGRPDAFRERLLSAYPRLLAAHAGPVDGTATAKVAAALERLRA